MRFKRHGDPEKITRKSPGTATDEDRKKWKQTEYQNNRAKYIERSAKRRKENPETVRAEKRIYLDREDVKIAARKRTKEWVARNKDKKREYDREWVKNNRAASNSHKASRRAKEHNATPFWLTKDQVEAIKAIYLEAERLSIETGVPHQVDHIVPLSGKIVSGLHVPWNLRAIPAQENNRRPRIWDPNTVI
jgi:hypothetical protein